MILVVIMISLWKSCEGFETPWYEVKRDWYGPYGGTWPEENFGKHVAFPEAAQAYAAAQEFDIITWNNTPDSSTNFLKFFMISSKNPNVNIESGTPSQGWTVYAQNYSTFFPPKPSKCPQGYMQQNCQCVMSPDNPQITCGVDVTQETSSNPPPSLACYTSIWDYAGCKKRFGENQWTWAKSKGMNFLYKDALAQCS